MKIALPLSEYFEEVKKDLLPLMGAIVARQGKHLDKSFEDKDILFHADGFINDQFDRAVNNRRFLEKLNSCVSLLSFDLGPSSRKVGRSQEGYVTKSPVLTESQILRIADKKIVHLRKYFKGVISVENLDYHPTGAYEVVCTTEFIYKFIKKFNLCLTLDIGHIEVTSDSFSINVYDYLRKLPLSHVREIHLTYSQGTQDSHMLPTEKEYKLLDFILERAPAKYIVLEYYCHPDGIIEGNRELMAFLKTRGLYEN